MMITLQLRLTLPSWVKSHLLELKKQRVVTRSSIDAEYRSLATTTSETIWLLPLFKELFLPINAPPRLPCDNLGATHLSFNPVQHSRMKHIQIDLHFVRDMVQKKILNIHHVNTHDQLADLLTKPFSRQRLHYLLLKIGLADGSSILRERIKEITTDQAHDSLPHVQNHETVIQA